MQPMDVLLEHGENVALRRVHPANAIVMVDIIRKLFAVTGVVVPFISDETLYECLPTKSSESEVLEIIKKQYTDPFV
jgi:hypothetical protein